MKLTKGLTSVAGSVALIAAMGLAGCEQAGDEPAYDEAAETVESAADEAADMTEDAAANVEEAAEDAVDATEDAVEDATGGG